MKITIRDIITFGLLPMLLAGPATIVVWLVIDAALPGALGLLGSIGLGMFFGTFFGWMVNRRNRA